MIRDARTRRIVYLPPEAKDVPKLMRQLVQWINMQGRLPAPLTAGIAHYRFETIHPCYDGNGRVARLLTTLILHLGSYDLKGLYALEEYYARDLGSYYAALAAGPSHNYYLGRAEQDITGWLDYFVEGMAVSCEKVRDQARSEAAMGAADLSARLRSLDQKQRRTLTRFEKSDEITSRDVAELFGYKPRTAAWLCQLWTSTGFLIIGDPAKKTRRYRLAR